jgi:Ca-activated chloride channel family protein
MSAKRIVVGTAGVMLVAALGLGVGVAPSPLVAARPASPLEVAIVAPEPGAAASGPVEVRVEVYPVGVPLARLEIYLDGLRLASLERPQPPYRQSIDAGEENVEHLLEVVAHAADGRVGSAQLRTPAIHSDFEVTVGLQQLYVDVTDRQGRPVGDLTASKFAIFDEGQPQKMVTFARGDVPFTATVLLDASRSMAGGRLQTALAGVRAFAGAMQRQDEAKLLLFADEVRAETPFTAVPSLLTLTLAGLQAGGGTALNDALFLALGRLEERQGRRVVIVLSDGVDVDSVLSIATVASLAGRSGAVVYWVRLDTRMWDERNVSRTSIWRGADEHRVEIEGLTKIVQTSGGRVLLAPSVDDIAPALRSILAELRRQYVLGYYPNVKRGSGAWHRLEVVVPDRLRARTRTGYTEP